MSELNNVQRFAAIHAARINTPSQQQIHSAVTGQAPTRSVSNSQPTSTLSATQRFGALFSQNPSQRSHLDPLLETQLMHRAYNN